MPTLSVAPPETCVPDKDHLLNRAEQDQDEAKSRQLRENAECDPQASGDFGDAEENGEALAHADARASPSRISQVFPTTRNEDQPNHQSEKQQPDVGELRQLRKEH